VGLFFPSDSTRTCVRRDASSPPSLVGPARSVAQSESLQRLTAKEARAVTVSRPFPSWNRSILTEIYQCHACSYHEIEDGNGPHRP
jgi:hypothetical protein